MAGPKLLIADYNEDFRLALQNQLQKHYDVRCCCNGSEALTLLHHEHFDYLVLDVMLPEVDGITLLERIAEAGIYPKTLALTPLLLEYILDSAQRLGVGYIMRKPCQIQAVAERILDMTQPLNPPARKPTPDTLTAELLLRLPISASHKGYPSLKEAIIELERNPSQGITKELYPTVAKKIGETSANVERRCRSAITAGWKNRDPKVWELYFPGRTSCPPNAVFLARMAEALRLELE